MWGGVSYERGDSVGDGKGRNGTGGGGGDVGGGRCEGGVCGRGDSVWGRGN